MIDTHAHIYSEEYGSAHAEMVNRALEAGINKIYMPAIDSSSHEAMMAINKQFPINCFPMMGLHPCHVKENYKEELGLVESWLEKEKFYAIGEAGIDLYWDKTFEQEQEIALRHQAELAIKYELPIVLHTRNATRETIDIISDYKSRGLRGIFHCFGGTIEEAKEIIALGFYLGIGGVATYKNGGLQAVLPHISLDNLVLETDAPYLAPVPHRGKKNEPAYLIRIAEAIATIKQISREEVISTTEKNAENIFSSSSHK